MDWRRQYMTRYYLGRPGWRDGTTEFHALCEAHVPEGAPILEAGAGPSNPTSRFLATLGDVVGVDPDRAVLDNDALSEARVLEGDHYPAADGAFAACVSNYVIEHVSDPAAHLREVHRVLRAGGVYLFRTPNLFHYVPLVAFLTPHWFHVRVADRARHRSGGGVLHPTRYLMNTRRRVLEGAARAGFRTRSIHLVEKEPSYCMWSRPAFLAGMLYERAVNAAEALASLRANLFVVREEPRSA